LLRKKIANQVPNPNKIIKIINLIIMAIIPWNTAEEFYDLHAKVFFSNGHFYHSNMIGNNDDEFAKYVISKLNLKNSDNVVDLGCGSGYLVNEISKICNCTGISNSKESIKIAKNIFPNGGEIKNCLN